MSHRESQRADVIAMVANQIDAEADVAHAAGLRKLMANLEGLPIEDPAWQRALGALKSWREATRGAKRFERGAPRLAHYEGDAVRFLTVLGESYRIAVAFWVMSRQRH